MRRKKHFVNLVLCFCAVLFAGCSSSVASPGAPPDDSAPPAMTPTIPILENDGKTSILSTGRSDYPLLAIFPGGETLVMQALNSLGDGIEEIEAAILITPGNRSLVVYFEHGLPVRAVAMGNLVEISEIEEDTATVTIQSPQGTISVLYNVPLELSRPEMDPSQPLDETALLWFAASALRSVSCAVSAVAQAELAREFESGCGLPSYLEQPWSTQQATPVVVSSSDTKFMYCGFWAGDGNLSTVSDCARLIVDAVIQMEASIPEFKAITNPETPVAADQNLPPTAQPAGKPVTYEGSSVSCTCNNCVCDTDPFFRVILTIDDSGNVEGVLEKYTEFFPELALQGTTGRISGSVQGEQRTELSLAFEGSLSQDATKLTATLAFQGPEVFGVRELVLYKSDQ